MLKQKTAIFFIGRLLLFFTSMVISADARLMVDQTGRAVDVPVAPKRVVSLAPSITEIIYDLNCEDRLKGATTYSDFPEEAQKLPKVGSYVYLDLEKIVSLKPDLCIGIKDGNPKEIVMRLESLGIPVYAVNPRSLESIQSTVLEIGELLQASERAHRVAGEMKSRIDYIRQLAATAENQPRVFFQIGISPIVSAGADTFIHELIEIAGGVNLAEKYTSYPRFSTEDIVVTGPDIIIITSMARKKVFDQVKSKWKQWPNIPAVKNDRIFLVDSDLFDRPTPRLIEGLEALLRLIHPELNFESAKF
ncbi:MAG: cobalamin-binding protein [Desulfobacteraceae bacterium]|nr:cobalamin-binding protein [Desulfobacteraceae bacterium]MBC2754117.1 cobalamin-binding protein [Desulfobacteraceae bacterium]